MVTPLDVIPSFHQALRNDMKLIDEAAYKAAAEDGDLATVVERLRFFSEILMWHAAGEGIRLCGSCQGNGGDDRGPSDPPRQRRSATLPDPA